MNPKRILLLNWRDPSNPLAGGAESHIWEVFGRIAAQGWHIAALSAGYRGCAAQERVGDIEVFRTGADCTYSIALPFGYRRVSRRFAPSLVVDFMNKLPLFTPLYVRRPLVCFVHHLFGDAAHLELPGPAAHVLRVSESLVPRVYRSTPFLTGSHSSVDELEALGIPRQNLRLVPYGTSADFYAPGEKSEHPSLLFLGRIKRYKGVDHVLTVLPDLVKAFPTLEVHIAGEGDDLARLKTVAADLGVGHCLRFLGYVSREEKRRLLQRAWLTCYPSVKEGFGLTVAEAALCGTTTVGYDVPGLRDAIAHDETGLLVHHGDLPGLQEAIRTVLADHALRRRLSEKARQRYGDFTWDRAASQMLDALTDVLEAHARGYATTWSEVPPEVGVESDR